MIMKKALMISLLILWFVPGGTLQAEPFPPQVVIKVATVAPKGHAMTRRMDDFNEDVKNATENRVAFKMYWGGVQGDDENVFRKIRMGQLHGGFFTGYALGQVVPQIRVTELPFVFKTDDEVQYVRDQLQPTLFEYFDRKGFVVLGSLVDVGFVYMFSKEPVTTVEKLRASKCWVPGEDILAQTFYRSMDIQPVPLSINDVMTSISTNLIDTAGMTPFGAIAFRWYTRFKYMADFPVTNVVGANIVTKRIWKKISPEDRETILSIANRYCDRQKEDLRAANHESMGLLQEAGINLVHLDPSERPEEFGYLFDAGKAAREELVDVLYSRELMEKTLSLVQDFRNKTAEEREQALVKKF